MAYSFCAACVMGINLHQLAGRCAAMAVVLTEGEKRYIPGVFVGSVPNEGTQEVVIEDPD